MQMAVSGSDVKLTETVLAEVVLAGEGGGATIMVCAAVQMSTQSRHLSNQRIANVLNGLRRRRLVDRADDGHWFATEAGMDVVAEWDGD